MNYFFIYASKPNWLGGSTESGKEVGDSKIKINFCTVHLEIYKKNKNLSRKKTHSKYDVICFSHWLNIKGASEVSVNLYCNSRTSVLGRLRDYLRLLIKRSVVTHYIE